MWIPTSSISAAIVSALLNTGWSKVTKLNNPPVHSDIINSSPCFSSSVLTKSAASHLVSGQNFEGGHDLVGRVRVGRLPRHEVNEGLEGDDAHPVGVHYAHDAGELILPLVERKGRCKAETLAKRLPCQGTRKVASGVVSLEK